MRKKGFMTIGYGNMGIRDFMKRIKELRINCIVDVRTRPYSKFNISFNKEELRDRLSDEGISYFWFGNKLGGKYDKIKYCDNQGKVDYLKVSKSQKFIDGIKELEELIPRYNVCIMCSEGDAIKCHRFLLISRALKQYNIYHIMPNGELIKNSELEEQLVELYGDARQISMFEEDNSETLEEFAYRKHGIKTSYESEKVKELLSQGVTEDSPDKVRIYCIGTEGKSAEEFFKLLKKHRVNKIIDVRDHTTREKVPFATYPDLPYYLKLNCLSYEKLDNLIPNGQCLAVKMFHSLARYLRLYTEQINSDNILLGLLTDELDGTCFLGYEEDYHKCHRHVITKELKKLNSNIIVRHLR